MPDLQEVEQVPVAPPDAPAPLTPEGANFKAVIERAQSDPDFAAQPEVKPIVEKFNEFKSKKQEPAEPEKKEPAEVEGTEENPFAPKQEEVKFEVDKFTQLAKEKFGIENPEKIVPTINKWRKDAETLAETQKNYDGLQDLIAGLPENLYDAVYAYSEGKDWEAPLQKRNALNYEKPFEKQKERVVNFYFKDKFKDADFDSPDDVLSNAITVAENKFLFEKQQIENTRADIEERGKARAETLKTSAISSVRSLEDSFPELDSKYLNVIKSELIGGGINKMFFNPDGSYKSDAAEKYALARYGKALLQKSTKNAQNKAENEKKMADIEANSSPKKVTQPPPVKLPEGYTSLTKGLGTTSVYDSVPSSKA